MAYTVLATAVTGDLWTAANHNTYIKDNFAAGVPDLFTTAGDIVYATGADTADRLGIGAAFQVLMPNSGGTAPEWRSQLVGCNVWRAANQTLTTGTDTKIIFDTEKYDTNSMWSDTDADAVLIPYNGIYQCSGVITFDTISSTSNYLQIKIGTNIVGIFAASGADTDTTTSFCYIDTFSAAEDAYLTATQYTGGNLDVTEVRYQITRLGAST